MRMGAHRAAIRAALALFVAAAGVARAAPPRVVSWEDAAAHVGTVVTVEGEVVSAERTGDTCLLEFAPDDPRAFRAILLLPLLSLGPSHPERLYRGKRVRATGRIQRFQGRPEMVLRGTDQLEVVGPPGTPASSASAAHTETAAPSAPPPASAPPAVETAVTPPAPPPRSLTEEVERRLAQAAPCERARARWRDAAAAADARAAALRGCLAAGSYRCRAEGAALGPALSALDWSEQQVDDACR